jgi:hypothetical protein
VLGAEGDVLPVSAAAGEDAGGEDAGGDEAGGEDAGGDEAGGDEAGGEDAGGDEAGGDDAGGDEAGGDEAGGEDAGGEDAGGDEAGGDDAGGWPGLEGPDPVGPPDDGVMIGVGARDVPLSADEAGLRNALGEIGLDAEGEAEAVGDAPGLDAGLGVEAGRVATAPAPVCGWRLLPVGARFAPINARAATAEPATNPPVRIAEASVRETRCRPGRLVPLGGD